MLHALLSILGKKNRRSNGACEISAQKRAVTSFCLLAEADVCNRDADEDECEYDGEFEQQLFDAST